MDVLAGEDVRVDRMTAHGGLFRTPGTPQRLLAAALRVPVALEETAGEGGAWGIAVLAAYLEHAGDTDLTTHLAERVFGGDTVHVADPDEHDVAGFRTYLERFRAGLPLQAAAVAATTRDDADTTRDDSDTTRDDADTTDAAALRDATTDEPETTAGAEPSLQTEKEPTR
jgi:hypothetical protein